MLTTAVAKEIDKNLKQLKSYSPTQIFVDNILTNKRYPRSIAKTQYTDDNKVTDHYAIIPTGQLTELASLNPLQSKVFELIVRRFLSIFYPPAEYQTLKLIIGIEKESLFSSARVLKTLGFLEVMGKTLEDADEEEIPSERQMNNNASPDAKSEETTSKEKTEQFSKIDCIGRYFETG